LFSVKRAKKKPMEFDKKSHGILFLTLSDFYLDF